MNPSCKQSVYEFHGSGSVRSYSELHALGTGGPELSGNNDLATLGAGLHDEAEDTIASTADGETVEELVAEGLALGDGGQTTVLDLGGVQGDGVLGELEALLDERGELTDAATLLSEDLLCVGGADDDVGDGGRNADLDAGVTLLSKLALEELVQLGVENTVCAMLATRSLDHCMRRRPRLRFSRLSFPSSMPPIALTSRTQCGKGVGAAYQRRTFSSWR
jgi:hypothetical protein